MQEFFHIEVSFSTNTESLLFLPSLPIASPGSRVTKKLACYLQQVHIAGKKYFAVLTMKMSF